MRYIKREAKGPVGERFIHIRNTVFGMVTQYIHNSDSEVLHLATLACPL